MRRGSALPFKNMMEESERRNGSNIILALDVVSHRTEDLLLNSLEILEKTHPFLCALKINYHLVLPLGLFGGVKTIVERAHSLNLPVIMDCKINDIGNTNRVIAENYFNADFDAVIANPFVGWEEGLQPVFDVAKHMKRGIILLVYMSHKASWEGYGQTIYDPQKGETKHQYVVFAEKALLWQADGVVIGAIYPDKIKETYTILKEKVPIYAPGVGAQGGDIKAAVLAGARYLIVGRAITESYRYEMSYKETAQYFRDKASKWLQKS